MYGVVEEGWEVEDAGSGAPPKVEGLGLNLKIEGVYERN